ncbi:hypothetical protein [Thioalbus denitrificans]|uniref:Uncharacterized protein n=1 Tax=Thioalbus denitrificans TaxID=547122 RepID=A0A369C9R5_9GAMM|nr:hypothetical protein [Thioalbus denitrificans]RCX30782.1 hypothetical protein DFQ59_104220 [Thioalbus denitrificans]
MRNPMLPDECELLDPLPAPSARALFSGTFEGRRVRWSAWIEALGTPDPGAPEPAYLEVGDSHDGLRTLHIGLPVAVIDGPTLFKTVIMVRQYKALRRGRQPFARTLAPSPAQP